MLYRAMTRLLLVQAALALAPAAAAEPDLLLVDNEWSLISPPAGAAGTSVAALFGDALPLADYGRRWALYAYREPPAGGAAEYRLLTRQDELVAGEGYWAIQATGLDVRIPGPDASLAPPAVAERGCPSIAGCTQVPLANAAQQLPVTWDLVGLPLSTATPLANTRLSSTAAPCELGCTLAQASAAQLAGDTMFRFRDGAYEPLNDAATLDPWDGVWTVLLPGSADAGLQWSLGLPVQDQRPDLAADYEVVFEDEFDGPYLDPALWTTGLLWGPYTIINDEEQLYVDTLGMHSALRGTERDPFVFTDQGTLKIVATPVQASDVPPQPDADDEVWGNILEYRHNPDFDAEDTNYLSGIITSYESFKFARGYTEMRAKIPAGRGLWPAYWMLPTHYVEIVPEIDIMEALGQFENEVYHTYHYFDRSNGFSTRRTPSFETLGPVFADDFHTYGVSWEPGQLIFYVDGMQTRRVRPGDETTKGDGVQLPYQAMFLLANVAVGGNWPGPPDASTAFPAEYEIDWIRTWKKTLSTPVKLDEYELVFSDEFDGDALDAGAWTTRFGWGPFDVVDGEQQYYVDSFGLDRDSGYSPFSVAGGQLTIRAAATGSEPGGNRAYPAPAQGDALFSEEPDFTSTFPQAWYRDDYVQPQYTSGTITSNDSFKFAEGYAEIRAQVPAGAGLSPSFRLLNAYSVGQLPQIDIMKTLGQEPGQVQHGYRRKRAGGVDAQDDFSSTGGSADEGFADGFHTFGVQWKRGEIHWYVDGELAHSYRNEDAPYQLMYLVANLAVGGGSDGGAVDPGALPAELKIDYIRVYQAATNG